jgi:hypothetical protein
MGQDFAVCDKSHKDGDKNDCQEGSRAVCKSRMPRDIVNCLPFVRMTTY